MESEGRSGVDVWVGARTSGLFAAVDDEGQVTHAAAEHAEGGERIIVTEIRW